MDRKILTALGLVGVGVVVLVTGDGDDKNGPQWVRKGPVVTLTETAADAEGVIFTRTPHADVLLPSGKVERRKIGEPDPTRYSPCYIAESIADCEEKRGPDCIARAAWRPHIDAIVAAGGSIPDPADCR